MVTRQPIIEFQFNFRTDTATINQGDSISYVASVYYMSGGLQIPIPGIQVWIAMNGVRFQFPILTLSDGVAQGISTWTTPDGIYLIGAETNSSSLGGDVLLQAKSNIVTVVAGPIPPITATFQDSTGAPLPNIAWALMQGTEQINQGFTSPQGMVTISADSFGRPLGLAPEILPYYLEGFIESPNGFYNPLVKTNVGRDFVVIDTFVRARTYEVVYKIRVDALVQNVTTQVFGGLAGQVAGIVGGSNLILGPVVTWLFNQLAGQLFGSGIRVTSVIIDPSLQELRVGLEQHQESPVAPIVIAAVAIAILLATGLIFVGIPEFRKITDNLAKIYYYYTQAQIEAGRIAFNEKVLADPNLSSAEKVQMTTSNDAAASNATNELSNPPEGEPPTWQELVLPAVGILTAGVVGAIAIKSLFETRPWREKD